MQSDAELLREHAGRASEAAFREIVTRHADLVYASALRQVRSPELARDITQGVFADLVRKAPSLGQTLAESASLVGWLYRSTRYAAHTQLRNDRRRQARERQAMENFDTTSETATDWEQIGPVLDEAMADLSDEDREAILLRYFKNHDFRAIGVALGVSDDAAQKRVSRALERLRAEFDRRGVTIGAGALAAAVSANAVTVGPAGLAAALSTAALTGTTIATTATATTAIAMTTLQQAFLIGAIVTVAMVTSMVVQHQNLVTLRQENQLLRQQIGQMTQLATENERLSNLVAQANSSQRLPTDQFAELLRLRGEITLLRRQMAEGNDLSKDPKRTEALQAALAKLRASASMGDAIMAVALFQPWWPVPELLSELAQIMKVNQFAASAMNMGDAIVGIAGGESSKMDAAFRPLLQDSNPKVRYAAAGMLAHVLKGHAGPDVIRVAVEALKSTDDNVRVSGLTTLANAAEDPKALANAVGDHRVWQSRVTTASLGPAADDATTALLDIAKNSQRTDVRDSALKMLENLNPDLTQLDPSLQASIRQSQQMNAFLDKTGTGKASLPEIIEGLHRFPKAAPMIAQLLAGRGAEVQSVLPALQDALAALAPQPDAKGPDRNLAYTGREQIVDAMQRISPDQPKVLFTQTDMRSVMEIIRDPEVRSDPDRRQKLSTAFRSVLPDERSSSFEMTPEQMHRLLEALKGADQPTYEAVTQRVKKIDPHFFSESAR